MADTESGNRVDDRGASGFTLLEILVALVVGSLVVVAICSLIIDQTQTHEDHQMKATMQQDGRAALSLFTSELMLAGYGPDAKANLMIECAGLNHMTFHSKNVGKSVKKTDYAFVKSLDGLRRTMDNAGSGSMLVRKVEYLSLLYAYDKDGLSTSGFGKLEPETGSTHWAYRKEAPETGPLDRYYTLNVDGSLVGPNSLTPAVPLRQIRAVKVWLLMRSGKHKNKGMPEVQPGAIPGYDPSKMDRDKFSYRLYTTTVKLRNMYY